MLTMKALRIERKIPQQAIAEMLGISQAMVSYLENGESQCIEDHKDKLQNLFNVPSANDLFIPYTEYLTRRK